MGGRERTKKCHILFEACFDRLAEVGRVSLRLFLLIYVSLSPSSVEKSHETSHSLCVERHR